MNRVSTNTKIRARVKLRSSSYIKDSIKTLKSCESLVPIAETVAIPQRPIRALSSYPSSPVRDWDPKAKNPTLWNGIDIEIRGYSQSDRSFVAVAIPAATDSWLVDLMALSLQIYKHLIFSMKKRDLNSKIVKLVLITNAKKAITRLTRLSRKHSKRSSSLKGEQRELWEIIITNLWSFTCRD